MNVQKLTKDDVEGQATIPAEHLLALVKLAQNNKKEYEGDFNDTMICSEIALECSLKN